jgi:hypothetical protein
MVKLFSKLALQNQIQHLRTEKMAHAIELERHFGPIAI